MYKSSVLTSDMREYNSAQYDSQFNGGQLGSGMGFDNRYLVQDSALLHTWQTNGRYLHQVMLYYS